jgi:hypothetical protein
MNALAGLSNAESEHHMLCSVNGDKMYALVESVYLF